MKRMLFALLYYGYPDIRVDRESGQESPFGLFNDSRELRELLRKGL
jgi:hypothetical protein